MFRDEQRVIRAIELDGLPQRRLNHVRMADDRDRQAVDFIQTLKLPHLRSGRLARRRLNQDRSSGYDAKSRKHRTHKCSLIVPHHSCKMAARLSTGERPSQAFLVSKIRSVTPACAKLLRSLAGA